MRYLIIDGNEVYEKFEITKQHLIDVKERILDMIIDTEEKKYFVKSWRDDEAKWHDMKPFDKRYE